MPPVERTDLKSTVVLWQPTGRVDRYGQPSLGEPCEIPARWLTKRSLGRDPKGRSIQLSGQVVTDRKLEIGARVWLGTIDDWYDAGSAGYPDEIHEVISDDTTPDIKGRESRYEFGLMRVTEKPRV